MKAARGLICAVCLWAISVSGASPVTVTLGNKASGKLISTDFAGLSFETLVAMADADGQHFFSRTNEPLIGLFKSLGIRNLRIGGNTADLPKIAIPTHEDIDNLFGFAKAAGVKVIYTLRLRNGDVPDDVAIASYIEERYKPELSCFAIGNEPDYYRKVYPVISNYTSFRDQWKAYADAVAAGARGVEFCGPSPGEKADWARNFANDFAKAGYVSIVTMHDYPGGPARRTTNASAAIDKMLSPHWLELYESNYHAFATTALSNGLAFRLEEANNFSDGGVRGASDTFAAALWVLDYLHWWAEHSASGINIHGRRWIPNCLMTNRAGAYELRPLAYGIKAFSLGGTGISQPVSVSNPAGVNLTAYAVRDGDSEFITLLNKEHGNSGRDAVITLKAREALQTAAAIFLTAPRNEASAKTGTLLGGSSIAGDGAWHGAWLPIKIDKDGACSVPLPQASAAVVKVSANNPHNQ
jgi:hypothetical protein